MSNVVSNEFGNVVFNEFPWRITGSPRPCGPLPSGLGSQRQVPRRQICLSFPGPADGGVYFPVEPGKSPPPQVFFIIEPTLSQINIIRRKIVFSLRKRREKKRQQPIDKQEK